MRVFLRAAAQVAVLLSGLSAMGLAIAAEIGVPAAARGPAPAPVVAPSSTATRAVADAVGDAAGEALTDAPIPCGELYTAAAGDTLYKIAIRAYGKGLFQQIFDANLGYLKDARFIEIGDVILIPCLDGSGPKTRIEAEAQAQAEIAAAGDVSTAGAATANLTAETGPAKAGSASVEAQITQPVGSIDPATAPEAPTERTLHLLTGSGFAPFADRALQGGGLIPALVREAVEVVSPGREISIAFVSDWPAHLEYLLRDGPYDLSFPWFKPDCATETEKNQNAAVLCKDFAFSSPFYEVGIGIYVREGDPLTEATGREALMGLRLCRPLSANGRELDASDLAESGVTVKTAASAAECFTRLERGQADGVSMVRSEAEAEISRLGLAAKVSEVKALASNRTLHAVVLKANPDGQALLEALNRGLSELMATGSWFAIVSAHHRSQSAGRN